MVTKLLLFIISSNVSFIACAKFYQDDLIKLVYLSTYLPTCLLIYLLTYLFIPVTFYEDLGVNKQIGFTRLTQ